MPRKTKKEKIVSQYRRQIKLLYKEPMMISDTKKAADKINVAPVEKNPVLAVSPFFYSDLRKSFLLITAIIALEIGMNFLKLIK